MINNDRIVPVTKIDLLSLYGLIIKARGTSVTAINASDVDGDFTQSANGTTFASQPVKSYTFGASVTSATVYFVPAYDFKGFSKTGATITENGTVEKDSATLYVATLASGTVTYTKAGF